MILNLIKVLKILKYCVFIHFKNVCKLEIVKLLKGEKENEEKPEVTNIKLEENRYK